jgi:hypothetical protein
LKKKEPERKIWKWNILNGNGKGNKRRQFHMKQKKGNSRK